MQIQTPSTALRPSSQRPVPLRRRNDLVVEEIYYRDIPFPVIKDPVALKYYRLQPEQYEILNLLNGQRSLEELRDGLQARFPTVHITPVDVQSLITDLHEKGLLISERAGQGETALKKQHEARLKKIREVAMNPLYMKLPGWDPDRTLTRLDPWFGWLFDLPAICCMLGVIALSWLFIAIRFDEVRQRLPEFQQFFSWPNLMYLWLTLAGAKTIHEFGHGLSCKHYGRECHSMGVMLLVFSPTLYCDVTDSWMLKNKWQRIMIGAAGMYVEMILAAVAIFTWYNTQPGLLNHLALNVFFVSTVTTVIFNLNPLLRYDGYYMLSDFLEIPNLRPKASKLMQEAFKWWALGIESPPDPFMPTSGKFWFITFVIASAIYRWVVLFAVTFFLYTVLKPYRLQSLGVMMAIGSLAGVFIGLFWNLFRMLSMPRNDPLSRVKIIGTMILLAGVIGGVLMIRVPWYEEAAFYVEPVGVQNVYNLVPGMITQVHVRPGDEVEAGANIATLTLPELDDKRDRLLDEQRVQQLEPDIYRQLKDLDGKNLAEQRLASLADQLADLNEQRRHLTIQAPVAGRVVAAPRVDVAKPTLLKERLPSWHGTPLDEENWGALLEPRTQICSIAPTEKFHAVLLINQADRHDIRLGEKVRMKLDYAPHRVLNGTITAFSDRELEIAPPALSNKYGGPLATVTDPQGREKLASGVYQADVDFDEDPGELRLGLRGRARFIVETRTLYDWLRRWFRQTFHFRL
ncbi:hypothetical protein [Planctomicrobium sp. SH664]|uniref:hypothetical protein n=1 Tax=Planctomicrobium sp. SH664 TaxID=3448125 RepID=UPI003F5C1E8E